ncbi:t-SNARE affecting a late Golgi compartment protein 2 [Massospora cicadina]|nr:t-SNARE affecting a late Golgi compartment protein 2 [Massospora cicadina]
MASRDRTKLYLQLRTRYQPNLNVRPIKGPFKPKVNSQPHPSIGYFPPARRFDEGVGSDDYEMEALGLTLSQPDGSEQTVRPGVGSGYQVIEMGEALPVRWYGPTRFRLGSKRFGRDPNYTLCYLNDYPAHKVALGSITFTDKLFMAGRAGPPTTLRWAITRRQGECRGPELKPKMGRIKDEVNEEIQGIQSNLATLESLHKRRLLPGFQDRTAEEEAIHDLAGTMFGQLQRCHTLTRQLGQASVLEEAPVVVRNAQISLATRLQVLSTRLQTGQAAYLEKLRAREKQGWNVAAGSADLPPDGTPLEGQPQLQLVQEELGTWEQTFIAQREREILTISDSLSQLADLFRSLQTLVIDQGTLLDRIDYNIESVAENVKHAAKELQTAVAQQRSSTSKGCIVVLLGLIVGMVLLLLLKAALRR